MKELSDFIQAHTYPLLRYDDDERPFLFASCVLQIDDSIYLVTAGHALKGVSTGLMTRGRSHVFDVTGRGGIAQGING